jgi:hypothetical protein
MVEASLKRAAVSILTEDTFTQKKKPKLKEPSNHFVRPFKNLNFFLNKEKGLKCKIFVSQPLFIQTCNGNAAVNLIEDIVRLRGGN